MAALGITAERGEARVTGGKAASVRVSVTRSPTSGRPTLSVASEQGGPAYPWASVESSFVPGISSGVVVFDPSKGPKPRPGNYPVRVTVESGGVTASVVVRFVVERHPCLTVRPHPSFTWDPFTSTAKVKVSLWSCGNVDLDVSWSAHVDGRRVEVDPLKLTVFADGGPVDTTLTIKIPEGVDIDTEIDLESLSEDGVKRFTVIADGGAVPPGPGRSRRNLWRAIGAVAVVAIVLVALLIVKALAGDDEVTTGGGPTTAATAEASTVPPESTTPATTTPTTQATTPTTGSTAATDAPPPPHLVVEGKRSFDINADVGDSGQATFVVANLGGRDADVQVQAPEEGSPFSLEPDGCNGALGAKKKCEVTVTFEPSNGGTYPLEVTVQERETGASLSLSVVGRAGEADLTVSFDADPWRTNCPGGAAECVTVIVRNRGNARSPATVVEVRSGTRAVRADLGPVEPGVAVVMPVVIARSCSTDCSARVTVDPDDNVREIDETNNSDDWFVVG